MVLEIFNRELDPYGALPVPTVLWWSLRAVLGGERGVFGDLVRRGRRTRDVLRELAYRRSLLEGT